MAKKKHGDRKDGRLIRDLDSLHLFTGYLFPNRCDSEAYMAVSTELAPIREYIAKKNETATFHYTFFHVIVAALAKVLILRPKLNWFISNGNFYERNETSLSFIVKKEFSEKGGEAMAKLCATPEDTMDSIHEYIRSQIQYNRNGKVDGTTESMDMVRKLPRFLVRWVSRFCCFLDKHGKVPDSFISTDPYHTSCVLSNVGSLKMQGGYHHLTNWGTCSVFCLIGENKEIPVVKDGKVEAVEMLDLGLTIDERLADGYYYSKSIRLLKYLLTHPEELDKPLKEEVNYE